MSIVNFPLSIDRKETFRLANTKSYSLGPGRSTAEQVAGFCYLPFDVPLLSMLNQSPTLDQVQRALSAVVINTPEERQRAQDMQTWINIISEKG